MVTADHGFHWKRPALLQLRLAARFGILPQTLRQLHKGSFGVAVATPIEQRPGMEVCIPRTGLAVRTPHSLRQRHQHLLRQPPRALSCRGEWRARSNPSIQRESFELGGGVRLPGKPLGQGHGGGGRANVVG